MQNGVAEGCQPLMTVDARARVPYNPRPVKKQKARQKVDCPVCRWRVSPALEHVKQLECSLATARALAESNRSPIHVGADPAMVGPEDDGNVELDKAADILACLVELPDLALATVLRRAADRIMIRFRCGRRRNEASIHGVANPNSSGVIHWREAAAADSE